MEQDARQPGLETGHPPAGRSLSSAGWTSGLSGKITVCFGLKFDFPTTLMKIGQICLFAMNWRRLVGLKADSHIEGKNVSGYQSGSRRIFNLQWGQICLSSSGQQMKAASAARLIT